MTLDTHSSNGHSPLPLAGRARPGPGPDTSAPTAVLTVVIPTRNEADGIDHLLATLAELLPAPAEVIFVDDSDDVTPYRVREIVRRRGPGGPDVRLVHRTGHQRDGGLGSAVVEGIRRARGAYVCVMDGDLQHPPDLITALLERIHRGDVDLVNASRYTDAGAPDGLSRARRNTSRAFGLTAKATFPGRLRAVTDPMSGFFLFRRGAVDPECLQPRGFKILLEILARQPELRLAEVGYTFGNRASGKSKATPRQAARYLAQLTQLRIDGWRENKAPRHAPYDYDVHGIITVRSDVGLPELERFRVRMLARPPAISVRVVDFDPREAGTLIDLTAVSPKIRFDEWLGRRGFSIAVEAGDTTTAEVSRMVARSPHVLYTNVVEPILRWRLVERGYALVHAACFTVDGEAHLVTARTDTGKTTTMLKILERGDYSFISDDLTLIDRTGIVLTYPKPLTISHHTVHALTCAELGPIERFFLPLQSRLHSRNGRLMAFKLAAMGVPVATLNTVAQIIIPPPKYHVDRLVPGVRCGRAGSAERLWIIRRGQEPSRDLDHEEAVEILLENCEDAYGFPPYECIERLMLAAGGDDLRLQEREIIRAGLDQVPARLLSSTTLAWAEDIHAEIERSRQMGALAETLA